LKYDLSAYRHSMVPVIKDWFDFRPGSNKLEEISLIALSTNCPIVVLGYLMLEVMGPDSKLEKSINDWETFYKVTAVTGQLIGVEKIRSGEVKNET
jgi:hypothetical protein